MSDTTYYVMKTKFNTYCIYSSKKMNEYNYNTLLNAIYAFNNNETFTLILIQFNKHKAFGSVLFTTPDISLKYIQQHYSEYLI